MSNTQPELVTSRLRLRPWRAADRGPFAAMNADAAVMEYFPSVLSATESGQLVDWIEAHFARHGFGFWAVEIPGTTSFAGFVGLAVPTFTAHFTPCIEIGWRLARAYWGHGFATEGARAALRFGFEALDAPEIVSLAVVANLRSRRVMERLGMQRAASDDFDHPRIPEGHRLRRHVLYRMTQQRWREAD